MQSAGDYASLIQRGRPDFIEIKGVTYNGDTKSKEKMTMSNVPWHEEVRKFGLSILASDPSLQETYELACEHKHSLCILIAHKKFKVDGKWRTHIDYDKFHELIESGEWKNASCLDFALETPHWAVTGAKEEGFDPKETRHFRKKRKDVEGAGAAAAKD